MDELSDVDRRVLAALVEGYEARPGMKSRTRALSEYEIARRAGLTDLSFAGFEESTERQVVRSALDRLATRAYVACWARSGPYDTFVPTETGCAAAASHATARFQRDAIDEAARATPPAGAAADGLPPLQRLTQQMDEALALLRSIERQLERLAQTRNDHRAR